MSRCFPYPPPGYFPRRTVDEALIESTKLQRETKKDKEDRHQQKDKEDRHQKKAKKERKREKKEKKREKKEKGKDVANEIGDTELNDKKRQKGEVGLVNLKGGHSQRIRKDEAEQLEKSDLTEEHGQPIYSQNSCHSSDSTQNSNKRKRHTSLSSGSSNHGNIIRLRLPLTKHKELESSLTKEQKSSERLPPSKDKGPEASLSKEQSSSKRLPLLKHEDPKASLSKDQSSSMRLPLLKHEDPKASLSKEQSSSMRLPLLKRKEPEASLNREKSRSIPKHREPETSVGKEQNCSIWMPLPKQTAPKASLREESCSTSGRVDSLAQQKYEISGQCIEAPPFFSMRTDTVDQKLNPRPDQQLLCSTSKVPEIVVHDDDDANTSKGSRSSKSKKQRAESRYKALVEDWVAPLLQAEQTDLDDQEWLFQKHGDVQEGKRHKAINYELRCGSWPCAQYLPEADVYALPFTVPF